MNFKGYGVSPGIAIGNIVIKKSFEYEITDKSVDSVKIAKKEFENILEKCRKDTKKLYEKMLKNSGKKEAQIFQAHLMILKDPEFIDKVISEIETSKKNIAFCLNKVSNEFITMFENMDDEYLKQRALDIKDIKERLLKIIFGYKEIENLEKENQIIVAKELTPSDTAKLDLEKVKGFITETGGETSHTAIMAKSLELPAIVGVKDIIKNIENDKKIILDASTGEIIIDPTKKIINEYQLRKEKLKDFRNKLKEYKSQPTKTKDGKLIELASNIGTFKDVEGCIKYGSEGIGLFRTEFLYMNSSDFPTEQEQFEIYKKVAKKMKNKPIIIRTMDIGGDKELSYFDFPEEMNPFLGYRAIRMCLDKKDLFKIQLRAILRASYYGNIKIMFPMISNLEELKEAKKVVDSVKIELNKEDIKFDNNLEIGMMIEVPSAAIISDILAKYVDFFSIGTNDLIQYTVAVDRMNENLKDLYNPLNPAILRLINMVIKNGHKNDIWVGMCGEVAGNSDIIPILLGMGLDEFSMSSINILKSRYLINNLSYKDMKNYSEEILNCETIKEIEKNIQSLKDKLNLKF